MLHKLLVRQMKRFLQQERASSIPDFVRAVDEAYCQADDDRRLLERSMDLISEELLEANSEMRAIFQSLPDLFLRLDPDGRIVDYKGGIVSNLYLQDQSLIGKGTSFEIRLKAD